MKSGGSHVWVESLERGWCCLSARKASPRGCGAAHTCGPGFHPFTQVGELRLPSQQGILFILLKQGNLAAPTGDGTVTICVLTPCFTKPPLSQTK